MFHFEAGTAGWQILMMLVVLVALILANEVARRTKTGGIIIFGVIPAILTIYFVAIAIGAGVGDNWGIENQTYLYMNFYKPI